MAVQHPGWAYLPVKTAFKSCDICWTLFSWLFTVTILLTDIWTAR